MSHNIESFKVASTLAANRILGIVGAGAAETAAYPTTTATPVLGVSRDTVLDTTSGIPVQTHGIVKVLFNDTATVGAIICADSSGRGVPFTAVTAAAWYAGILVGAAVTATGTVANILLMPGLASTEA